MNLESLYDEILDQTTKFLKFGNRTKAWAIAKPNSGETVIKISIGCGSLHEPFGCSVEGIAHFLEHRLFWYDGNDVSEQFANMGIDINAFTNALSTDFVVYGRSNDGMCAVIEKLFEIIFRPTWSIDGLDREREIISHELALYKDDPEWVGYYTALKSAYGDERITREIAGNRIDLNSIDLPLLKQWHRKYFNYENFMLFISSDQDIDKLFETAVRCMKERHDMNSISSTTWDRTQNMEIFPARDIKFQIVENSSISRPQLVFIIPFDPSLIVCRELARHEISIELILDILWGPSGKLYEKLYREGLMAYGSMDYELQIQKNFGFIMLHIETEEPYKVQDEVIDCIQRFLFDSVNLHSKRSFERAKKKALGILVRSYESCESCVELLELFEGLGSDPSAYTNALLNIKEEEAIEIAMRYFSGNIGGVLLQPCYE